MAAASWSLRSSSIGETRRPPRSASGAVEVSDHEARLPHRVCAGSCRSILSLNPHRRTPRCRCRYITFAARSAMSEDKELQKIQDQMMNAKRRRDANGETDMQNALRCLVSDIMKRACG